MSVPRTGPEIRAVNTRYHDVAAEDYDRKWGIDFGLGGRAQVLAKLRHALGPERELHFARSLEIGAGTGYFSLNLLQAGVMDEAVCSDISPGMLAVLEENAARLGVAVETAVSAADALPFPDETFDLVLGHAVLHHLPDLPGVLAEVRRVLAPGGLIAFAGEPSRYGDRISCCPKRTAAAAAPAWRALVGAAPAPVHGGGNGSGGAAELALELAVDVHAFAPRELAGLARDAGFDEVRVCGAELLASWFGWTNRVLEASAEPSDIPWLWRQYAHRGYLALQRLDRRLLEPRLPPALFYNLLVSARRPGAPRARRPCT